MFPWETQVGTFGIIMRRVNPMESNRHLLDKTIGVIVRPTLPETISPRDYVPVTSAFGQLTPASRFGTYFHADNSSASTIRGAHCSL